jgi:hypothetical protein
MNDVTEITNPEVLRALFAVRQLNDVREQLLAHRQRDGDLITAMRLLEVDRAILRGLEYCLSLEANDRIQEMYDRTVRVTEETREIISMLEQRNAEQHATLLEARYGTIH